MRERGRKKRTEKGSVIHKIHIIKFLSAPIRKRGRSVQRQKKREEGKDRIKHIRRERVQKLNNLVHRDRPRSRRLVFFFHSLIYIFCYYNCFETLFNIFYELSIFVYNLH